MTTTRSVVVVVSNTRLRELTKVGLNCDLQCLLKLSKKAKVLVPQHLWKGEKEKEEKSLAAYNQSSIFADKLSPDRRPHQVQKKTFKSIQL